MAAILTDGNEAMTIATTRCLLYHEHMLVDQNQMIVMLLQHMFVT